MELVEIVSLFVMLGIVVGGFVYCCLAEIKARKEYQKREHEQRLKELSKIFDEVRK